MYKNISVVELHHEQRPDVAFSKNPQAICINGGIGLSFNLHKKFLDVYLVSGTCKVIVSRLAFVQTCVLTLFYIGLVGTGGTESQRKVDRVGGILCM